MAVGYVGLESLLNDVRDQFLRDVNAKYIASEAHNKEIISEGHVTRIKEAKSDKEANEILFTHLYKQATPSDLEHLVAIMIGAKGYRRMNEFGKTLRDKMTAEEIQMRAGAQCAAQQESPPTGTHPPAGAMSYADGPPPPSSVPQSTPNASEFVWLANRQLELFRQLFAPYGLPPSASHGMGGHVPTTSGADRTPTSNISQEPPPSSVPLEPPPSSVPQEPPLSSVPQEPPPSSVPLEPPPSSVSQEPPPSSVPQEPPPSSVPQEPPPSSVPQEPPPSSVPTQGDMQRGPYHGVAMAKSFGQRSLPFYEQAKIASAVCRTVWKSQINDIQIYGSGSFVSCLGKFYLLTCYHNFLWREDGNSMSSLPDDSMEKILKSRCRQAVFLCSTRDFKGTVTLKAAIVLVNPADPVLIFSKEFDLLAVEVMNPADFPCPIEPIPLQPCLRRESLLKSAMLLTIAHFPPDVNHRAECLEFAVGLRLKQRVCQDTQVVYTFDTYHGSSGSPVFFAKEGEVVLLAVHQKSTQAKMRDETGQLTNTAYNIGSVLTQDFLRCLLPNV